MNNGWRRIKYTVALEVRQSDLEDDGDGGDCKEHLAMEDIRNELALVVAQALANDKKPLRFHRANILSVTEARP